MKKTKLKKLVLVLTSVLLVSCFSTNGGKNLNYSKITGKAKVTYNGEKHKIKLDKNLVKGNVFYHNYFDDYAFITSKSRFIIKISLKNNKIDWIKEISTIPQNNIVADKEYVYFNGVNNNFYILNNNTGEIESIFFNNSDKTVMDAQKAHIYKDYVVAFFSNNEIFIINRANKQIIDIREYKDISIDKNIINIDNDIINLDLLNKNNKKKK
ncbi:MAG: hypothetical protein IJ853_03120 [Rickettsiales bacterium]|nr:hypothetical protein [Rickettsiales bacterium]